MRIARDGFTGSGAWDTALWPYTDWQDSTGNFRPTLTQQDGLGVITNYTSDYGYVRRYFAGGVRQNYGVLARGRFTTAGSNANMRVMIRASRDAVSGDKTYPDDGYTVFFERGNTTVSVQKVVNGTTSQVVNFTIASAPGTGWWNVRLEAEGTTLRIKFWTGVSTEPTAFNRTVTDTSLSQGEAAVSTGYHANQVTQIDYFETYDFLNALTFTGSITPAGVKRKQARRRLQGLLTPAGPTPGPGTSFGLGPFGTSPFGAGTVATGGSVAVRRVVTRLFSGSITASGVPRRALLRLLRGSITPSASYGIGRVNKILRGSLAPTGEQGRRGQRRVTGTLTPIGDLIVRSVGRISGRPGIVAVTVRVAGQVRSRVRKG